MTDERITELAKQAGFSVDEAPIGQPYVIQAAHYKVDDELRRFHRLVRNEVLDEAADLCDELQDVPATEPHHCAQDIRGLKS